MRRKPYTENGISRVPCARCGEPSIHQWQICATGNNWCGVCEICDVALNAVVIEFMKFPKYLTERYIEKRKVATIAGRILRDPRRSKRAKSVAGAALSMLRRQRSTPFPNTGGRYARDKASRFRWTSKAETQAKAQAKGVKTKWQR